MKVLLINGSPKEKGCTYTALLEISKTLQEEGVDSEIYNIGNSPIAPCRACGACGKLGRCAIDDEVNELLERLNEFDGIIIGSPVHYASASGGTVAFLDRLFYANARAGKADLRMKPGSAIASARRAGTTATIDELNKYFQIHQMPIISGRYWNMVHGQTPDDVKKDLEGLQNMRFLARNMAYYLKCIEAGKNAGIKLPKQEEVTFTNFIQ